VYPWFGDYSTLIILLLLGFLCSPGKHLDKFVLTLQSTVVTLCTTVCFNIRKLYNFRNTVCVRVAHGLTINSDCLLKNIKQQVFVMAIQCLLQGRN